MSYLVTAFSRSRDVRKKWKINNWEVFMKKRLVYGLCFLSMVLMVALPVYAAAEETVKLAVVEPFSGTFKDVADRYTEGITYAVKKINASGGLLGKKLEVMQIDAEGNPAVAARKATAAIMKDGIKFMLTGSGSAIAAALSQVAEKQNAILIGHGPHAASLTGDKCSRNFFRTCINTDISSNALAIEMGKRGYKSIGIIAQDYSFGHEAVAAFKKKLSKVNPNAKIASVIFHPMETKDYAPYISQLLSSKPDAVFSPNWGNDLRVMLKQAIAMGMKQKVFGYFMNDELLVQSFGNDDEKLIGYVGAEVYAITIPTQKNKEFVADYYKVMGNYPTWLRGKGYIAVMYWAEAVKKAGTFEVNDIINAWEGLLWEGPTGKMIMRPCDHQAQVPVWTFEFVKKNPFFKHVWIGPATMVPAKDVEVPCEETGCKMKK
jgi:branched-chain amino acid transport system substrate-binding protein